MSLPRFVLSDSVVPKKNMVVTLGAEQARHLSAIRLSAGDSLELLLSSGPWRGELTEVAKNRAAIRLVAPVEENREAPIEIHACLPITAQLGLWDEFLPGTVELGATLIQPVIFERSQYDRQKTEARMERWRRIILAASEQSHRTRIPDLRMPISVGILQSWEANQRWIAYEASTEAPNPEFILKKIAFAHGPEGGITDTEIGMLTNSGWKPITLGKSIIRAATCPAAILGAIQVELGRRQAI